MAIGESVKRVDAAAKVTGRTRFASDNTMPGMRVAHYLRSPIAHGYVKSIDTSQAKELIGVDAVFTFEDVPTVRFATAGHAYNLEAAKRDVEDRLLLTRHVRYHGDEIAVVVAEDDLIAKQALSLIEVEYEEYPPILTPEDAMAEDAMILHPDTQNSALPSSCLPKNVIGSHEYSNGDAADGIANADVSLEGTYQTQFQHHCHMETVVSWGYMDDTDHIVIESSTQIPHICRRIVAQALEMPIGRVRIIKPPIGGGFGNKQDVLVEPMVGFLASKLGGLPVRLELTREECISGTRVRHPFKVKVRAGADKDGTLKGLEIDVTSNTGAYASHGHSIASAAGSKIAPLYPRTPIHYKARTHYTTLPAAGAMRAYGCPQATFALDGMMEELAREIEMDPVDFRLKNGAVAGDPHPISGKPIVSAGVLECLKKGREIFKWDEKRKEYAEQEGPIRRGVGVACFSYGSNTWPVAVEISGCRMILNQDGSVNVQTGACEIGQGSDTVITQIAAEYLGIPEAKVKVLQTLDTDSTPYDPGAFASRQTYVFAHAVRQSAEQLREKIIAHASLMTEVPEENLGLDGDICGPDGMRLSLEELAYDAYYNKFRGEQLTSEVSHKVQSNAYSYGCTFVEIEVDISMCKVEIKNILNVHDSGRILNPQAATGQVHGGAAMGIAYAMSEELLFDPATGKIHNNNLLDYKMPTCSDVPEIDAAYVETDETTSACGHKSIGEPPLITPAPAIRNAIWHATGVKVDRLPMGPKELFVHFREAGLLGSFGE